MADPQQKIKKLEPLMKIRKSQLDQETVLLNQIKHKREAAVEALYLSQKVYIEGVEKLNHERQSSERKMLDALERGVDFAKAQWYQRLKILKTIEEDERRQLIQVTEAQKRMKMIEHLDERYLSQQMTQLKKQDQKQMDEFAIQANRRKATE